MSLTVTYGDLYMLISTHNFFEIFLMQIFNNPWMVVETPPTVREAGRANHLIGIRITPQYMKKSDVECSKAAQDSLKSIMPVAMHKIALNKLAKPDITE